MDFFEAQERAKSRTTRLVVLFVLAVLGLIAAAYVAVLLLLNRSELQSVAAGSSTFTWWDPQVLAGVSVATVAIVGGASLFKWLSFRSGGSAVAEMVGARRVDPASTDLKERRLLNVVEEMAIASGLPVPPVYLMENEAGINAFAAGLTASDAIVAVTRGTLEKLNRDELQGVIGHEFSHVLNGDMRLNVKLSAVLFGILVLGLIGRSIMFNLRFSGRRRSGNRKGGGGLAAVFAAGLAMMAIGYIGYFFGRLIQAAVSRQREYLADAAAVQFTRNPAGIGGALRKIGGYELGSRLRTTQAAQIGHFFFGQALKSNFGGLWATHPPLTARILAIDPAFDGKFFEPETVVDVNQEPWSTVRGIRPPPAARPAPDPAALVASIGVLSALAVTEAHDLLGSLAPRLREAAHSALEAPSLVYALLIQEDPTVRARQLDLVAEHDSAEARQLASALLPLVASQGPEYRLPLVQLSLGSLRALPPDALPRVLGTLDELVHADRQVTTFEFALQKVLVHHLQLARRPTGTPAVQIHSFHAVATDISVVLSALAHAAAEDPSFAFAAGAKQLKLLEGKLALLPPKDSAAEALDAALDKLARASIPIRKRLLVAAAAVATADGTLKVAEAELLRALSASLDCPMPALARE